MSRGQAGGVALGGLPTPLVVIKLPTSFGIIKKAKEFQKNICFINYSKAFDCGSQQTVENS